MTLGHRVVILRHGTIEQAAPPLDLYRAPVNRFVAEFLGSPGHQHLARAPGRNRDGRGRRARAAVSAEQRARLARLAQFHVGVRPSTFD